MGRFDGQVAVITGAARGQGRSHAVTLAEQGADIVAIDIAQSIPSVPYALATPADLKETARLVESLGRRVLAFEADVRDQDALDHAISSSIAAFGKIDKLVVNHGIGAFKNFWEITDEEWTDMLDVLLTGTWRVTKAVAPHMIERESGSIVMIGSVNAVEPGVEYSHYNSAKAGVVAFSKNVALELGRYGVNCNCVLPGAIDTDMVNWPGFYEHALGPGKGREELEFSMANWTALKGRGFIQPKAVSDTVAFLLSDEAKDITGVVIPVDAGHLNLPGYNGDPVRA
ncbi:mycofactocin-coupled SDR family oxidoreductase [Mycolicibacterium goodii]|uniref:mycofactocin-coupled SDR family oxidoreductase n=1 Tax=Mycolicibacterium goodii TaxID=134601 RepID=UPI001BDC2F79|nr:mycofactocin-coupled SDR family oxidoreductase [Mycolicibacterium goodii]MBU8808199.1 mycofactocin-coupled SDR family oxidoreductase [Mycolicibacterium goodii]